MKTLTFGIQYISGFFFFNKPETSWQPIAVSTHYHATAHIFLHFLPSRTYLRSQILSKEQIEGIIFLSSMLSKNISFSFKTHKEFKINYNENRNLEFTNRRMTQTVLPQSVVGVCGEVGAGRQTQGFRESRRKRNKQVKK